MAAQSLFDKYRSEICLVLGRSTENAIEIQHLMTTGLSGAEVYRVELKGPAFPSGIYFLKLSEGELKEEDEQIPFPHASCVVNYPGNGYTMQLIAPAGLDLKKFFTWREHRVTFDKVGALLRKHLDLCQKIPNFLNGIKVSPDSIIKRMLNGKLNQGSLLQTFLESRLSERPELYNAIKFQDRVLPNAYAFAVDTTAWKGKKINDANCPAHGDMHGENIMFSCDSDEYCLIDCELYKKDSWLFFDTAYFELAELLEQNQKTECSEWLDNIHLLAQGQHSLLDFSGIRLTQTIGDAEETWIEDNVDAQFSHKEFLDNARILARVIAGLNFAGKKRVNDDTRTKAFIYACVFLEQLLGDIQWNRQPKIWYSGDADTTRQEASQAIASWTANFDTTRDYILVVGPDFECDDRIGEVLARIHWKMVISFNPNPEAVKLKAAMERIQLVTSYYPGVKEGRFEGNNPGWLFAAGFPGEFTVSTYREWNKRCYDYVNAIMGQISSACSANDPLVIIDANSMRRESRYWDEIIRFCQRKGLPTIAILDVDGLVDEESLRGFDDIEVEKFAINMQDLAIWCNDYLASKVQAAIMVPASYGIKTTEISPDLMALIQTNASVISNTIIAESESGVSNEWTYYKGHPPSWREIASNLPVMRSETEQYEVKIKERDTSRLVTLIEIPSKPGAGATIICKTIAWDFRSIFPTLEIYRINNMLGEGLHQIHTLSGMPLLLIADNDFSAADIDELKAMLTERHIAAIILYTWRYYDTGKTARSDVLGPLDINDARSFLLTYQSMLKNEIYPESIKNSRNKSLQELSEHSDMISLRLPFFYGMFTFEKDFISIETYITRSFNRLSDDEASRNLLLFLALLTKYTSEKGLPLHIAMKIAGWEITRRTSRRQILDRIFNCYGTLVISRDDKLRLVHPCLADRIISSYVNENQLADLCISMLTAIDEASDVEPGPAFEEIAKNLFIDRGDIEEYEQFSPLITAIPELDRARVFDTLVHIFPENAHFHLHFGRLLSIGDPTNTSDAHEHLSRALELAPEDPFCWHSLGTAYLRRIRAESKNFNSLDDLFNELQIPATLAFQNFEKTIEIQTKSSLRPPKYPLVSIMELATILLHRIKHIAGDLQYQSMMGLPVGPINQWLHELQAKAATAELEIAHYGDGIGKSDFLDNIQSMRATVKYSATQIEKLVSQKPHDIPLKIAYLNLHEPSTGIGQEILGRVTQYGEDIIRAGNAGNGIMWRWFTSLIKQDPQEVFKRASLLEVCTKPCENLLAAFLLYSIYFARAMNGEKNAIKKCLEYLYLSRNSSLNQWGKYTSRLTYAGNGRLSSDLDEGQNILCRVAKEVRERQSGELYMEQIPEFHVFFVPYRWDVNIGQSLNKEINCRIGLSYGGFRAVEE